MRRYKEDSVHAPRPRMRHLHSRARFFSLPRRIGKRRDAVAAAFNDLVDLIERVPFAPNKPNLVLAETTKGAGISFMENNVTWHHHVPSDEELALALAELEEAERLLEAQSLARNGAGEHK